MEERRRLTRDRDDRMLGGVCSGIAKHFDLDPTLVRIAFVILAFVSGVGIIAYVVMWLLLPADDRSDVATRRVMRDNVDEMAERARLAAASAQAAAEAARQAADQLAETARAAGRAARETWQQGSQQAGGTAEAGTGTPMSGTASEGWEAGSERGAPAATSTMPSEGGPEGTREPGVEEADKPGETTPEGSGETWPPSRELPSTDVTAEPSDAELGEGQGSGPPRM
ncbi:MAG: PspC domain-containing protein [Dehalococcoidia bacterium]